MNKSKKNMSANTKRTPGVPRLPHPFCEPIRPTIIDRSESLRYHSEPRPGKIEVIPTKPYNGRKNLWDFAISYDENDIKRFSDAGFNIVLIHKVKNYTNTEYLEDIDRMWPTPPRPYATTPKKPTDSPAKGIS